MTWSLVRDIKLELLCQIHFQLAIIRSMFENAQKNKETHLNLHEIKIRQLELLNTRDYNLILIQRHMNVVIEPDLNPVFVKFIPLLGAIENARKHDYKYKPGFYHQMSLIKELLKSEIERLN